MSSMIRYYCTNACCFTGIQHLLKHKAFSTTSQQRKPPKLQAVLRPFIFSVHPDLFGGHPGPKLVNEASLKILNEYIQCDVEERRLISSRSLKFYQKTSGTIQSDETTKNTDTLKVLQVKLEDDVLQSVKQLLAASDLPLDDIDEIIGQEDVVEPGRPDRPVEWINRQYYAATGKPYPFTDIWEEIYKLRPAVTLHRWVTSNIANAQQLSAVSQTFRDDYMRLLAEVIDKYSLTDVVWSCGWRGTHQLSCLRKLDQLLSTQHQYRLLVKDKSVIFGNVGGVSFDGDVVLCIDEVPEQWCKALSLVSSSNSYLELIPPAERQLSSLINGIQIVHRDTPPIPMAEAYYSSLASLIGRLGMAQGMSTTKPSQSLQHIKLAVTGSMGDEMTLTPEGHISVPSHSPVWAIKKFIEDNEENAMQLQVNHDRDEKEALRLIDVVTNEFSLQSLSVDSSVSHDKVIVCCENLLINGATVRHMLSGIRLCIAPYFAVMNDGEMYIMWNWVNDT